VFSDGAFSGPKARIANISASSIVTGAVFLPV
jgi:hypothetical protein